MSAKIRRPIYHGIKEKIHKKRGKINGILLPKLFWPIVRKKNSRDQKNISIKESVFQVEKKRGTCGVFGNRG